MDCKEYLPIVSAYADEAVTDRERVLVEKHLSVCSRCAEELKDIRRIKSMAFGLGQTAPKPYFETRVMSLIAARNAENALPSVFAVAARMVFAAGVCALLITAGFRSFFPAVSAGSVEELLVRRGAEVSEDMLLAKAEISENDIIALSSGREVQEND